jgi:hypothetical protein
MKRRDSAAIYYEHSETGCLGQNCSRYKFLFNKPKLLNIAPAPAAADLNLVKAEAQGAVANAVADARATIRDLARQGNLAGIVLSMLIRGTGGQAVCEAYGQDCECHHIKGTTAQIRKGPPIQFEVTVTVNGVAYTAAFELTIDLVMIEAKCLVAV